MKKRIAVFAHYDKDNIIDDYVIYYLKELKKVAEIVFVSDCDLPKNELKKIGKLVIKSIAERHGEYDFGSYKRGYKFIEKKLKNYDEFILCNDSNYGPFCKFLPIFERMEKKKLDVWGMFSGYAEVLNGLLLQSHFLVFNKATSQSKILSKFLYAVKKEKKKADIVLKYEFGLTSLMNKHNLSIEAAFTEEEKLSCDVIRWNAMKILKNGYPFLKKNLFDPNYLIAYCTELVDYKKIIKNANPKYNTKLIERNIYRCIGKKVIINYFANLQDSPKISMTKFSMNILHKKFIKLRGRHTLNKNYKISIAFLGITFFKIIIPKIVLKKYQSIKKNKFYRHPFAFLKSRFFRHPFFFLKKKKTKSIPIAEPIPFQESKLAHHYLDGLNGVEIGASTQNPFGLNKTGGYCNIDFEASQGWKWQGEGFKPAVVNIVSSGDSLPLKSNSIDYVISSHVIEHFFDPIKAIKEWLRVVLKNGYIFIVIPHKDRTFDKDREESSVKELLNRHNKKLKITDYVQMTEKTIAKQKIKKAGFSTSDNPHQLIKSKKTPPGWERFKEDDHHHWCVWKTEGFLKLCKKAKFNVIDHKDIDDKVGNGFVIVIKK